MTKRAASANRSGAVINFEAAAGSAACELVRSGDEAEAGGGHGAGLARHGVGKALALERGRQVHFTAGKKAGKKLHDHLHSVAQTGRLRLMEWGSSLAGADIGLRKGKLNRKSEALDMKSDTECDKFWQLPGFVITYKALARNVGCYAACSYAPCSGDMALKNI
ncbi:hypothetical protein [Mesorhizobium temperatum]|uniref:hypothetical protein n=1 Tax=Mesorhizobium temperatum TaxID=241416 RepID=UPI00142E1A68|nr:hypothetical protein [Mesorhizobium temperatum]